MSTEIIVASIVFKPQNGKSVLNNLDQITALTIEDYKPSSTAIQQTNEWLIQQGLIVQNTTEYTSSFLGEKQDVENLFNVVLTKNTHSHLDKDYTYWTSNIPLMHEDIANEVEFIELSPPGIPRHLATPPSLSTPYYHLNLSQIPTLLNADTLHTNNIKGQGVRVSMVDTGFYTKTEEEVVVTSSTNLISVDHNVVQVYNVCTRQKSGPLPCDEDYYRDRNFGTTGSFSLTDITLAKNIVVPLASSVTVYPLYSCIHPYFTNNNYSVDSVLAALTPSSAGEMIIYEDFEGHGEPVAANLLSIAPEITFSAVQYFSFSDGLLTYLGPNFFANVPVEGFKRALLSQNPDIITCSWAILSTDGTFPTLRLEIANAVAQGVTVLFPSGNGALGGDNPFQSPIIDIAHPDIISVGGAYPQGTTTAPYTPTGVWEAANYASSFYSLPFINASRHCPDVVGICGQAPNGMFIMSPTQEGSTDTLPFKYDEIYHDFGDGTDFFDGWCVSSGTSAATPQVAGIAALLLQQYPTLTPRAVKNILMNAATTISQGQSATGQNAASGWDEATGYGLVHAQNTIDYLQTGFTPLIRDYIEDVGGQPGGATDYFNSPDILVKHGSITATLADQRWGITAKYRADLTAKAYAGQPNYLYLRVQNMGDADGNTTCHLFYATQGDLGIPANWVSIGSSSPQNIVKGDFKLADPQPWTAPSSTGTYYIIAILDNLNSWNSISSLLDFENYILNNRFAACKRVSVIPASPVTVRDVTVSLGSLDIYRTVQLEVEDDEYDEIAVVELEFIPPFSGPNPVVNPVTAVLTDEVGNIKTFTAEEVAFETDPASHTYTITTKMLNSEGIQIGETQEWSLNL